MLEVPQFILDRCLAKKPVFTADEVAGWPQGLCSVLEGYELIRPMANASSVRCDACGMDHLEQVTMLPLPSGGGFRAYILCPQEGRVSVPLDRLRQWMVDVPKVIAMTGWTPPVPRVEEPAISDPIRLTVTEVAKYIGVSTRTISQWRTDGKLFAVEDENGQLTFSKSSLDILRIARA